MGSDLEAFSRNPADGSFAALAFQLKAMTTCLDEMFFLEWSVMAYGPTCIHAHGQTKKLRINLSGS